MNRSVLSVVGIAVFVGGTVWGCGGTETKTTDSAAPGGTGVVIDAMAQGDKVAVSDVMAQGGKVAVSDAMSSGGSSSSIESLVPRSNDIPEWTVDPSQKLTASLVAAIGKDKDQAEALIDGSAAAFFTDPFTAVLAWQNYIKNGVYTVDLHLWEMPTATQAKDIYSVLVTKYPLYSVNTWTPLSGLGDEGRICNTGTTWWINVYKGKYCIEINLNKLPSGSEESDTTGRDELKAFATELLKRF